MDRPYALEWRFRRRAIHQSDARCAVFGREWSTTDRSAAGARWQMAKRPARIDGPLWTRIFPTIRIFRDEGQASERSRAMACLLARWECRSRQLGRARYHGALWSFPRHV